MSDDSVSAGSKRWPTGMLLAAALIWLGVAAALGIAAVQDYSQLAAAPWRDVVTTLGSFILQLLPPLAVTVLAFVLLRRRRADQTALLAQLETRHLLAADAAAQLGKELDRIGMGLDTIAGRFETLGTTVETTSERLWGDAARLDAAGRTWTDVASTAAAAGEFLAGQLTPATAQAEKLTHLLGDSSDSAIRQFGEVETMLAGLWSATDDAAKRHDAAVTGSRSLLAALGAASEQTLRNVGATGDALHETIDTALVRTDEALGKARDTVTTQTANLLAGVDQAQVALDDIGGAAARTIGGRLERVLQIADSLGARLSEEDARSRAFIDGAERNFQVLDAKFGNSAANGNTLLDGLSSRLDAVRERVHVIAQPLSGTHDAVLEIESSVGRLEQAAAAIVASLRNDLPATASGIADIEAGVTRLREGSGALVAPLAESDATAMRIGATLGSAHALAEAINTEAGSAAITASTQLIEVLARVREVANATAGTMRETLADIVTEAEEALRNAGSTRAREAFGAPIQAEIARLESAGTRASEAAQEAAERVTQRLVGLTRTVATVEARIDEVDTRYDVMLRDDISKRSEALLASLNSAAIDIGKMLSIDVGDDAWAAYLKGDKGIFARRAVRLLDRGTARQVARHYQHDAPFREQAVRFITEFETLLQRVMPDREGKALAVTLLSSDIGKLYVVLAQATERLR